MDDAGHWRLVGETLERAMGRKGILFVCGSLSGQGRLGVTGGPERRRPRRHALFLIISTAGCRRYIAFFD
ncbi:MAG: hypothetical protein ACRD1I_08135, partial [Terriglobia bacterium]